MLTALATVGALYFNTQQTSEALQATRDQMGLSEQGQLSERFNKAVEQLGNKSSLEVRLGGIYALERIARDSGRDHPTVMEVLSAYVREHAPLEKCNSTASMARPSTDVQAILTVIGRRDHNRDRDALALNGTCLSGADLTEADLSGANLGSADLAGANLRGAEFVGANLSSADGGAILVRRDPTDAPLLKATFYAANLREADLRDANLTRANLTAAILDLALLSDANLRDADVTNANLRGALLDEADLRGADLRGADVTNAYLGGADLRGADLHRARGLR